LADAARAFAAAPRAPSAGTAVAELGRMPGHSRDRAHPFRRLVLLALLAPLAPRPARAAPRAPDLGPAPSGQIVELTAGDRRLFALRDADVLTFDAGGTPIGRCASFGGAVERARGRRPGAPEPDEILRDAALPDDDSTLAAEEALEDEDAGEASRRARPIAAPRPVVPRALAAAGGVAWAATSDGLYRVDPDGCRRAGLAGRALLAVAARATAVVAASADALFVAALADGGAPEALPAFRPLAPLSTGPRALALDGRGAVLVADGRGIARVGPDGSLSRLLDSPADALATCGALVAALAGDAVYLWDGARLRRAGQRPPGRRLGCGDGPARRWIAVGAGLWASADARAWSAQPGALGATVTAAAALAGRLWIASEDGLLPLEPSPDGPRPGPPSGFFGASSTRSRAAAPASWLWPEVITSILVDRTPLRRTVTAFVLLRFAFGRSPPPAGDRAAVAGLALRRDAALARAQLLAAAAQSPDPVASDELAARQRLLADAREALW
jgi:hypothetical protein